MDKKEQLLLKIKEEQQKLQNNNYLGVIDERKTRIDALVKALTILELDDEEIEILLRQKDLLTTLANQEPKWKTEINKYVNDAVCDIGHFINVKSSESHRKRNIDEEM